MNNEVTQNDLEKKAESVNEQNENLDVIQNETMNDSIEETGIVESNNEISESSDAIEQFSEVESMNTDETEDLIQSNAGLADTGNKEEKDETESKTKEVSSVEEIISKPLFSFVDETEASSKDMEPEASAIADEPETNLKDEEPEEVHQEPELAQINEEIAEKETETIPADEEKIVPAPESEVVAEQVSEETETSIAVSVPEQTHSAEPQEQPESKEEVKDLDKEAIRSAKQQYIDSIYNELKIKIGKKETIEVEVNARVRGGLRVHYKDIPMFLPTSHFVLKKNPPEEIFQSYIGQKIPVYVHEFQEYDQGRKAVIVSRKKLLIKEMWDKIQVGDIVEGRVTSVATYGVFVDFDGIEGLAHVSQLSKIHIDNPKNLYKKGHEIKARIIEINRKKRKVGLSCKEFADSPWKGVEEEFKPGTQINGKIKRLTEFGAYIQLKPGVDGLLRNNELSWTKRGVRTVDILNVGEFIDVVVVTISEKKESATLSQKRITANPWPELAEKLKPESEHEGTVTQVLSQGAIIRLYDEIEGFIPRSKMRQILKGNKIPLKPDDKLIVTVSDLNPDNQSLILAPKEIVQEIEPRTTHVRRQQGKSKESGESTFSLGDMLSESEMQKLKEIK